MHPFFGFGVFFPRVLLIFITISSGINVNNVVIIIIIISIIIFYFVSIAKLLCSQPTGFFPFPDSPPSPAAAGM